MFKNKIMKILINISLGIIFCFGVTIAQAQNKTIFTPDLEILMVADFDWVYNDSGTGAGEDLSIWKPKTNYSGFYALGHNAFGGYGTPQGIMLMVKGRTPNAVKHPVDYLWKYNDSRTGGEVNVSIWEPVPPPGYKALGTVAVGHYGKPSLKEVVCIREDLVIGTTIGKRIWHDAGSGGEVNGGVWYINPPIRQSDKKAYLTSGSFICATSHSAPRVSDVAYALEVDMHTTKMNNKASKPTLTSTNEPPETTKEVLVSKSFLPCISVNDPSYINRPKKQISETPVYTLERWVFYKRQGFSHNKDYEDGILKAEFQVGMESGREKSMSTTFETSATLTAGVESGIYSASASVTMSYAVSHSQTVSTTRSNSQLFGNEYRVPAKGAAALYTLSYKFILKNGKGRQVNMWKMDSDNSTVFVTYDPSKNNSNVSNNNSNNYTAYLDENFSNNQNRWLISNETAYETNINNGQYSINNKQKTGYVCANVNKPIDMNKDFQITTQVQHIRGIMNNGYGIIYDFASHSSFKTFEVSADGHYRVLEKKGNSWNMLKAWDTNTSMPNSITATNILTIEKEGYTVNFYVNGNKVHSMPHQAFAGNELGLLVFGNQQVKVDYFKINYKK
jgi:hypothetical protein